MDDKEMNLRKAMKTPAGRLEIAKVLLAPFIPDKEMLQEAPAQVPVEPGPVPSNVILDPSYKPSLTGTVGSTDCPICEGHCRGLGTVD